MEENNYLVESFGNSLGADIAEFAGEAIEFTLDTCVGEDGILKDIPFVGTALKLCNISSKVQEKHSFYKLKAFIREMNAGAVSPEELENRKQKFLSKAEFRQQELEFLLILIDRYISINQPKMLAKLYLAYLDEAITWEEFTVYAEVIDRFLPGDWLLIDEGELGLITLKNTNIDRVLRLVSMGLVTQEVKTITHYNGYGEEIALSNIQGYELTDFGKKFKHIILK